MTLATVVSCQQKPSKNKLRTKEQHGQGLLDKQNPAFGDKHRKPYEETSSQAFGGNLSIGDKKTKPYEGRPIKPYLGKPNQGQRVPRQGRLRAARPKQLLRKPLGNKPGKRQQTKLRNDKSIKAQKKLGNANNVPEITHLSIDRSGLSSPEDESSSFGGLDKSFRDMGSDKLYVGGSFYGSSSDTSYEGGSFPVSDSSSSFIGSGPGELYGADSFSDGSSATSYQGGSFLDNGSGPLYGENSYKEESGPASLSSGGSDYEEHSFKDSGSDKPYGASSFSDGGSGTLYDGGSFQGSGSGQAYGENSFKESGGLVASSLSGGGSDYGEHSLIDSGSDKSYGGHGLVDSGSDKSYGGSSGNSYGEDGGPKPFNFGYAVNDEYHNTHFNAEQEADGKGRVRGSYSVLLPDGRTQTVEYQADHGTGFRAHVQYKGEAVYDDTPHGGYQPSSSYNSKIDTVSEPPYSSGPIDAYSLIKDKAQNIAAQSYDPRPDSYSDTDPSTFEDQTGNVGDLKFDQPLQTNSYSEALFNNNEQNSKGSYASEPVSYSKYSETDLGSKVPSYSPESAPSLTSHNSLAELESYAPSQQSHDDSAHFQHTSFSNPSGPNSNKFNEPDSYNEPYHGVNYESFQAYQPNRADSFQKGHSNSVEQEYEPTYPLGQSFPQGLTDSNDQYQQQDGQQEFIDPADYLNYETSPFQSSLRNPSDLSDNQPPRNQQYHRGRTDGPSQRKSQGLIDNSENQQSGDKKFSPQNPFEEFYAPPESEIFQTDQRGQTEEPSINRQPFQQRLISSPKGPNDQKLSPQNPFRQSYPLSLGNPGKLPTNEIYQPQESQRKLGPSKLSYQTQTNNIQSNQPNPNTKQEPVHISRPGPSHEDRVDLQSILNQGSTDETSESDPKLSSEDNKPSESEYNDRQPEAISPELRQSYAQDVKQTVLPQYIQSESNQQSGLLPSNNIPGDQDSLMLSDTTQNYPINSSPYYADYSKHDPTEVYTSSNPTQSYQSQSYHSDLEQTYDSDSAQSYQSEPTQSYQPSLSQSYQSESAQSYQSDLSQIYQADPSKTYQSNPTQTFQPDPAQSYQPTSTQTYQSNPTQTYQSNPPQTYQPDPAQSYQVDPTETYQPDHAQSYQVDPNETYQLDSSLSFHHNYAPASNFQYDSISKEIESQYYP